MKYSLIVIKVIHIHGPELLLYIFTIN